MLYIYLRNKKLKLDIIILKFFLLLLFGPYNIFFRSVLKLMGMGNMMVTFNSVGPPLFVKFFQETPNFTKHYINIPSNTNLS